MQTDAIEVFATVVGTIPETIIGELTPTILPSGMGNNVLFEKLKGPTEPTALTGKALPGIQTGELPAPMPQLSVSPNPTTGIVNVHFDGDTKHIASVTVSDLNGGEVLRQNLSAGMVDVSLDLTSFPKGMYVITIRQDGREFSEKVVLN